MANCERFQEIILTDYIDNQLSETRKIELDNHLMVCVACRMYAQKAKNDLGVFDQVNAVEADPFLWQRVKRRVEDGVNIDRLSVKKIDLINAFLSNFKPYVIGFCLFVIFGFGLVAKQSLTAHEPYLSYVFAAEQGADDERLNIENYFL